MVISFFGFEPLPSNAYKMEEVPQPPTSDDEWFALELVGSDSLFLDVNSKLGSILVGEKSSEASQVIIDKTRTVY